MSASNDNSTPPPVPFGGLHLETLLAAAWEPYLRAQQEPEFGGAADGQVDYGTVKELLEGIDVGQEVLLDLEADVNHKCDIWADFTMKIGLLMGARIQWAADGGHELADVFDAVTVFAMASRVQARDALESCRAHVVSL